MATRGHTLIIEVTENKRGEVAENGRMSSLEDTPTLACYLWILAICDGLVE